MNVESLTPLTLRNYEIRNIDFSFVDISDIIPRSLDQTWDLIYQIYNTYMVEENYCFESCGKCYDTPPSGLL